MPFSGLCALTVQPIGVLHGTEVHDRLGMHSTKKKVSQQVKLDPYCEGLPPCCTPACWWSNISD